MSLMVDRVNDPRRVLEQLDLELIAFYASGMIFDEIGKAKYISPLTVRNRLARARERVGARSLTHLCVLCVDCGVIVADGTGYVPVVDDRVVG